MSGPFFGLDSLHIYISRSEAEDERKGVAVSMPIRVHAFLCRSGPASQLYRDVRPACKSVD